MALKCFNLATTNPSSLGKMACKTPSIPCFSPTASPFSLRFGSSRRSRSQILSVAAFTYIPRGFCGSALLPARNRRSFLHLAAPHDDSAPVDDEFEEERSELEQRKVSDEADLRASYVGSRCAGALLSLGSFLYFMLTRNTDAILFGVIPGGTLLAYSVPSFRSWRFGKKVDRVITECETALVVLLFLSQLHQLFQKPSFPDLITTAISGAVVAFFIYKMMKQRKANYKW